MSWTNLPTLAALAALPLALAAGSAQAQTVSYCAGRLSGQPLASTQTADNITTTTYYMTLHNSFNGLVVFQVRFASPDARVTSLQPGGVNRSLGSRQSMRIDLASETGTGSLRLTNSLGNGVSSYIQLVCQGSTPPPRPRMP